MRGEYYRIYQKAFLQVGYEPGKQEVLDSSPSWEVTWSYIR